MRLETYPLRWAALASLVGLGCSSALEAPSAYETTQYLCDEPHAQAWTAAIDVCRAEREAGGSCAGVMSLRGVVDGQSILASKRLLSADFSDDPTTGSEPEHMVRLRARADYSDVTVQLQFKNDWQ